MTNNIALISKYVPLLDEVYKQASKTSVLDGDSSLAKAGSNANEICIPKIQLDGLGDYSRNDGYVKGSANIEWETVKFNYDRGRKLGVDAMDNEETAGIAFGKLSSEFIRTKVVPEMDAFRFASYAALENITVVSANLADGEAVLAAIAGLQNQLDEAEVPAEERYLFITPTNLRLAQTVELTKNKKVLDDFAQIITVPQSRFYTAITLKSGKTDDELAGGYEKAADAKDINFMIIHKPAVLQYPKHTVNKVISPEANQESDGYLFFYRAYGLVDAYENKRAGIGLHHKA